MEVHIQEYIRHLHVLNQQKDVPIGRRATPGACQELDETLHATDSYGTAEPLWLVDMDSCAHLYLGTLHATTTYASLVANVISNYPSCISISMFWVSSTFNCNAELSVHVTCVCSVT